MSSPLAFSEQRKRTRWAILGLGSIILISNFVACFVTLVQEYSGHWYVPIQCVEFMYTAMELFYFFRFQVFSWWLIFGVRTFMCCIDFLLLTTIRFNVPYGILVINVLTGIIAIVLYSRLWDKSCWKVDPFDQETSPDAIGQIAQNSAFGQKSLCARGFIPPLSTFIACSNATILGLMVYWDEKVKSTTDLFPPMLILFVVFLTYEVLEFVYFFWFKVFSWRSTLFMRVCMLINTVTWLAIFSSQVHEHAPWSDKRIILFTTIKTLLGLNMLLQLSCIACYWKIKRNTNTIVEPDVNCEENIESIDQVIVEN